MRKFFTKCCSLCCSLLILCCFFTGLHVNAVMFTPNFELHSASAMVIGLDTDTLLYQKNQDVQHPAGALVQIMAAALILEQCNDLNTKITADASLYSDLYSDDLRYADIYDGDILTVEELLYAMLLTSSCEAASILAHQFGGGSEAAFAEMMNQKAEQLGCTNTHFVNATGLHDNSQVTTASDMAIITEYALSVGKFETIATASSFKPATPNLERHDVDWSWSHSNMLTQADDEYYMEGVKGIKTANDQGRNLISIGSKDGNKYLVVLLAAPVEDTSGELQYYNLDDATNVFSWLFNHFSYENLLDQNTELGQIKVENGDGMDYVLVKPAHSHLELWYDAADIASVTSQVTLYENVSAPVKAGDKLGTVELKFSGESITVIDLVATSSVELSKFKYCMAIAKHFPKTAWFTRAIWLSVILCVLYLALCIYSRHSVKKRLQPIQPVHLKPRLSAVKKEAMHDNRKTKKSKEK